MLTAIVYDAHRYVYIRKVLAWIIPDLRRPYRCLDSRRVEIRRYIERAYQKHIHIVVSHLLRRETHFRCSISLHVDLRLIERDLRLTA